ncbi:YflJ family protein [Bacillus suaedae]|uniref:YflJ family protein n=1 Tax=Halalkalibacter suaedae TaxID=2822140 RepID=A0A940WU96_9BACI|nr:YflJ family protein [Bacillus suaedae]MBP3952411.1 YflJ family protein [Bacillus suaedae]
MYVGTKGWYVQKLKDLGIRYIEGRKIERYKAHVLANLYFENK